MSLTLTFAGTGLASDASALVWTKDATSNIGVPQNWTEWQAVLTSSNITTGNGPLALYLLQETTASIADSIGGVGTILAENSPRYSLPIPGWSRTAVGINGPGINSFGKNGPNSFATNSVMMLLYTTMAASKGPIIGAYDGGGVNLLTAEMVTTPRVVGLDVKNSATGTVDPTAAHRPLVMLYDYTNSRTVVYTDQEKFSPVFATGSGITLTLGGMDSYSAPAIFSASYWAIWEKSNAELTDNQVKTLLKTLGWSPSWPPTVSATKDATSGIYIPQNWTEWQAVLTGSGITGSNGPSNLWLMQEAAGNLNDSIGSLALSNIAGGTYQNTITGWSTKALAGVQGSVDRWITGSFDTDLSVNSAAVLLYGKMIGAPGSVSEVFGMGGGNFADVRVNAAGNVIAFDNANHASATGSQNIATNLVRPIMLKYDFTNSNITLYTDQEKVSPTFSAINGTTLWFGGFQIGALAENYLYATAWTGHNAEMTDNQIRSLFQTLGWTPAW